MAKKKLVRITLTLPDGTRKYFSGATRKEAEKKRDEAKLQIANGYTINSDVTFKDLSTVWLKKYKARDDIALRTYETAEGIFRRYLDPYFGKRIITEIKPIDIDQFLLSLSSLSKSTQKKCLEYASGVFNLAIENTLIPRSPAYNKKPIASKPKKIHALTRKQCDALLDAVKDTRAFLFILVLLRCGLRKGEALALMWKDIDFDRGMLTVDRSLIYSLNDRAGTINPNMKTDAAHRTIPLTGDLLMELKKAKAISKSVYVFSMKDGAYLSEASFRRMWDLVTTRTVGSEGKREFVPRVLNFDVHPHQLRHTCCTNWIAAGLSPKEVQYLMGHASSDITMDVYAEYIREQELEATANKIRGCVYSGNIRTDEYKEGAT